ALRNVADVDLRVTDGSDAGRVHGLLVPVGHALLDRLVEKRRAAQLLDDDLRRNLALAEARNLHVAARGLCDALHLALDCIAWYLYFEADAGVAEVGLGGGNWHGAATIA